MIIDLQSVALTLIGIFILTMLYLMVRFMNMIFKFPGFREKIWHGITDGDNIPHQDDFKRTLQLFYACVLGTAFIITLLLWIAFRDPEFRYITPCIGATFLTCIGLSIKKHSNH